MKSVKRLEIVVERTERSRVLEVLAAAGVDGWTILPVAVGQGSRGERRSEGLPGGVENDLILAAADEASLPSLAEALRPILSRWGGMCLVSDARWLLHGPREDKKQGEPS